MNKVVFHPKAIQELSHTVSHYYDIDKSLSLRFIDSIENGIKFIQENQLSCPIMIDDFRKYKIRKFPYGIIYKVKGKTISIIALMHLHRKPFYWLSDR